MLYIKILLLTLILYCPLLSKGQINVSDILQADADKDYKARQDSLFGNLKMPINTMKDEYDPEKGYSKKTIDNETGNAHNSTPPPTSQELIDYAIEHYKPEQAKNMFPPTVYLDPDANGDYPEKKFTNGLLGYDLTKSISENEERYKNAGYTISYSIKDSTIIGVIIGVVIIIILLFLGISIKENNKNKFTAEN